jgi:hypothetical protein
MELGASLANTRTVLSTVRVDGTGAAVVEFFVAAGAATDTTVDEFADATTTGTVVEFVDATTVETAVVDWHMEKFVSKAPSKVQRTAAMMSSLQRKKVRVK